MTAMTKRRSATKHRPHMLSISVAILASATGISLSTATADTLESAELAAVLRQLDIAERIARSAETVTSNGDSRYHFDYARLHADIARIRAGIEDYLHPKRAQPRDPHELSGDYRRESPTP
jgi:RAQPRD family integrative conjugative element protein